MHIGEEFSDLPSGAIVAVGIAVVCSLIGSLTGLAGLLMWGIKAFDMFAPASGDPPFMVEAMAPYFTVFNFALMVAITVLGVLNLMLALRWQEFLEGGWKRWLVQSALSILAGLLFIWTPNAVANF